MLAKRKLLDQVSDVARFRHLSLRTEEAYRNWIKRYIFYHGKRHPLTRVVVLSISGLAGEIERRS
jgi:hypothetical protein